MTFARIGIEFVVRVAGRERVLPPEAIAAVLRLAPDAVRSALAELAFAGDAVDNGVERQRSAPSSSVDGVATIDRDERFVSFESRSLSERIVSNAQSFDAAVSRDVDSYVTHLADQLGDHAGFAALARLVASHSRSLLDEALRRTLAIRPEHVRRSRGAAFTSIVRALARADTPSARLSTTFDPHA